MDFPKALAELARLGGLDPQSARALTSEWVHQEAGPMVDRVLANVQLGSRDRVAFRALWRDGDVGGALDLVEEAGVPWMLRPGFLLPVGFLGLGWVINR